MFWYFKNSHKHCKHGLFPSLNMVLFRALCENLWQGGWGRCVCTLRLQCLPGRSHRQLLCVRLSREKLWRRYVNWTYITLIYSTRRLAMLLFEEGVVRVGVNSQSDPLPETMQRAWKDQILKSDLGNQPQTTGKMFYKINKAHTSKQFEIVE